MSLAFSFDLHLLIRIFFILEYVSASINVVTFMSEFFSEISSEPSLKTLIMFNSSCNIWLNDFLLVIYMSAII